MGNARTGLTTAHAAGLLACTRCHLAQPPAARCRRCRARLRPRAAPSLQPVWAWLAAGIIAYIPANLYPMLTTRTLIREEDSTIVGGAIDLFRHGSWGIAAIILIASIGIPLAKFAAIVTLGLEVRRGPVRNPHGRLRLYEVVEFIGRWSMIDVFVVAILAALVQLDTLAAIKPGPAAATFALSVVFTMLAAQSFDQRLIWHQIDKDNDT